MGFYFYSQLCIVREDQPLFWLSLHYANESCISAVASSTLCVYFSLLFWEWASIVFERNAYSYKIPDQFRSECFLVKDAAEPELNSKRTEKQ